MDVTYYRRHHVPWYKVVGFIFWLSVGFVLTGSLCMWDRFQNWCGEWHDRVQRFRRGGAKML